MTIAQGGPIYAQSFVKKNMLCDSPVLNKPVKLVSSNKVEVLSDNLDIIFFGIISRLLDNGNVDVTKIGLIKGMTGLQVNKLYYIDIDGSLTITPPASGDLIISGQSISTSEFYVDGKILKYRLA